MKDRKFNSIRWNSQNTEVFKRAISKESYRKGKRTKRGTFKGLFPLTSRVQMGSAARDGIRSLGDMAKEKKGRCVQGVEKKFLEEIEDMRPWTEESSRDATDTVRMRSAMVDWEGEDN